MLSAQPTHISDYAPCFSFTLLSLVLLARAAQAFAHVHKALGRAHGQANDSPGDTSTSRVSRHHRRWYCWHEQDTSLYMCTRHWSELTDRQPTMQTSLMSVMSSESRLLHDPLRRLPPAVWPHEVQVRGRGACTESRMSVLLDNSQRAAIKHKSVSTEKSRLLLVEHCLLKQATCHFVGFRQLPS